MLHTVADLLRTRARRQFIENACFDCAQSCVVNARACSREDNADDLARCIRLNLDCADACEITGLMLTRQHQPDLEVLRKALELCELACDKCAAECAQHALQHELCRICEQRCRNGREACRQLLAELL